MNGWRKKLLCFTFRAAQSLVIPLVVVLAVCYFLKFMCIVLRTVPENGLQAFVWSIGASDRCESEGGHRNSNGAHHAEGGHGSAVPCWHCHDRYWQDRWVTETKGVLCQYTVFALFQLWAECIQDGLCVCCFKTYWIVCFLRTLLFLFTVAWYKFFSSLKGCKGPKLIISF